jgi:hypothetical protein
VVKPLLYFIVKVIRIVNHLHLPSATVAIFAPNRKKSPIRHLSFGDNKDASSGWRNFSRSIKLRADMGGKQPGPTKENR